MDGQEGRHRRRNLSPAHASRDQMQRWARDNRRLLREEAPPRSGLGLYAAAHQVAKLQHLAVRETVIDVQSIALTGDEAELVQAGQVPGSIRLGEPGVINQFSNRTLAISQRVQQAHARRVGERLEALGDQLQQLRREWRSCQGTPPVQSMTVLE